MPRKSPSKKEFELHLFGTFHLQVRAGSATPIVRLPRRKVEALLAYLVLFPELNGHPREKLAALFWGDTPDEQARTSLRTSLAVLRKTLGEDALLTDRERVQLNPEFGLRVDVWEFLELRFIAPESAVKLYSGDVLSDSDDEWLLPERAHLRSLYIETLLRLAQQMRSQSEYERAIEFARQVIAVDPANETAHQHMMFCEMARGNRAAALKQYAECARAIHDHLALQPSQETQALYNWIAQTSAAFSADTPRITNLPIPLSSFVGRKKELAQIKSFLAGTRLLTLVGAGGSGKTRLSIQVSMELMNAFHEGAWWVELANLTAPTLVSYAVAKALRVNEIPHQSILEMVVHALRYRHMLLILDNCEHLLAACTELVKMVLQDCPYVKILTTSREPLDVPGESVWQVPTLSIPSDAPTREQLSMTYEGVRLFVERAKSINPAFKLTDDNAHWVEEICRRLDGIPLAIELAAARVQVLSVQQIAARLDDRFSLLTTGSRTALARQQTLRALIDWSYDLLSKSERGLFRRLAVFAGGWTLPAAESVASGEEKSNVQEMMTQLVNKSLLVVAYDHSGDLRYRFLDTIRQYAYDRLLESDEAEKMRERHYAWAVSFAETTEPQSRDADQLLWLTRLEAEHDNMRAALVYARQHASQDAGETIMRLAAALVRFWSLRGYWTEGRIWLAPALDSNACTISQAKALIGLADMVLIQESPGSSQPIYEEGLTLSRSLGDKWTSSLAASYSLTVEHDVERAHSLFNTALELAQGLGDPWLVATAYHRMGMFAYRHHGDAYSFFEQGLLHARQTGDQWLISSSLVNLGEMIRQRGDFARAAEFYEEALPIQRKMGDMHGLAVTLHNQGHVALCQHDLKWATSLFKESFAIFREHDGKQGMIEVLAGLGGVAAALHAPARAAKLLSATDALLAELKSGLDPTDRATFERNVASVRQQMPDDAFKAAWTEGGAMTLEQASALALSDET